MQCTSQAREDRQSHMQAAVQKHAARATSCNTCYHKEGKLKGGLYNFLIDILMVIALFGPLMFLVVIPTGLVIVALGIGLIGEKFTLLLGFFVFPRVIVWLHSWLILLFFLMAPKRLRSGTPVQGE